jgi:hypothetical protein
MHRIVGPLPPCISNTFLLFRIPKLIDRNEIWLPFTYICLLQYKFGMMIFSETWGLIYVVGVCKLYSFKTSRELLNFSIKHFSRFCLLQLVKLTR